MKNIALLSLTLCLLSACSTMTWKPDDTTSSTLLNSKWYLAELAGEPVAAETQPWLEFSEDGRVSGNASCNRLFGSYELDGEALSFGPLGTTRMFCPDPAGGQENRLLGLLDRVVKLQWSEAGELMLVTDDEQLITAHRR